MGFMEIWNIVTLCLVFVAVFVAVLHCLCRRLRAANNTAGRSQRRDGIRTARGHQSRGRHRWNRRARTASGARVYVISMDDQGSGQPYQPPPEYKWEEELPPTYDEAIIMCQENPSFVVVDLSIPPPLPPPPSFEEQASINNEAQRQATHHQVPDEGTEV